VGIGRSEAYGSAGEEVGMSRNTIIGIVVAVIVIIVLIYLIM
jgi:hypothetical protein